jgi:hypothetical protein
MTSARDTADAFLAHPGRNIDGALTVATRHGDVRLAAVVYRESDGRGWVDVYVGDTRGSPYCRVVNPPTLVEHPQGEVVRGSRRFKEDPVGALAGLVERKRRG